MFSALAKAAAAAAKLLQSCPTLCDPIDGSPPGSAVPGILQARTLEWVAISFSNAWKFKVKVKSLSRVRLLATPWTAACQGPPSMGFSRQEYWSGVTSLWSWLLYEANAKRHRGMSDPLGGHSEAFSRGKSLMSLERQRDTTRWRRIWCDEARSQGENTFRTEK